MDGPNGTKILAAFPMTRAMSGEPNGFYILAELPSDQHDRYVTAWMRNLTDASWTAGAYYPGRDANRAMVDALDRAGWRGAANEAHL